MKNALVFVIALCACDFAMAAGSDIAVAKEVQASTCDRDCYAEVVESLKSLATELCQGRGYKSVFIRKISRRTTGDVAVITAQGNCL